MWGITQQHPSNHTECPSNTLNIQASTWKSPGGKFCLFKSTLCYLVIFTSSIWQTLSSECIRAVHFLSACAAWQSNPWPLHQRATTKINKTILYNKFLNRWEKHIDIGVTLAYHRRRSREQLTQLGFLLHFYSLVPLTSRPLIPPALSFALQTQTSHSSYTHTHTGLETLTHKLWNTVIRVVGVGCG